MSRRPRLLPRIDSLEDRALLSGGYRPELPAEVGATRPGGGISTAIGAPSGAALSNDDLLAFQKDAYADNLQLFLIQTELALGTRQDVRNFAGMLLTHHRDSSHALSQIASAKQIDMPDDINMSSFEELSIALTIFSSPTPQSVDDSFLQLMFSSYTMSLAALNGQNVLVHDADLKSYVSAVQPSIASFRAQTRALIDGGALTLSGPAVDTSTSTLAQADVDYLRQAYSSANLERYLSQVAELTNGRNLVNPGATSAGTTPAQVNAYATTLINASANDLHALETVAAATHTTLGPGMSAADLAIARQVLQGIMFGAGGTTGNPSPTTLNPLYLSAMVQSHDRDAALHTVAVGTVHDARLTAYAQASIVTGNAHRQAAQALVNGPGVGRPAGGGQSSGGGGSAPVRTVPAPPSRPITPRRTTPAPRVAPTPRPAPRVAPARKPSLSPAVNAHPAPRQGLRPVAGPVGLFARRLRRG